MRRLSGCVQLGMLLLAVCVMYFQDAVLLAQEAPAVVAEEVQVAAEVEVVAQAEDVAPPAAAEAKKEIRAVRIGPAFDAVEKVIGEKKAESPDTVIAAEAVTSGNVGVMSLVNGNTIAGELCPSESPKVIRWQGSEFTEPFDVLVDAVKSIKFPAAKNRAAQTGEFAFELASGDLLAGQLLGWTDDAVDIDSSLFGKVIVHPNVVRRIYRIEENPTIVFSSLSGLQDWTTTDWETEGWQEDGAHLWTDQADATLNGDLHVPDKAMIEFQISWTDKPNFIFAIAVDAGSNSDSRTDGWRFETFEETLAAVREHRSVADVARVESLKDKKSIRLLAYLDQTLGQCQVFRPDGTQLAVIAPAVDSHDSDVGQEKPPEPGRGIRLINRFGDVRLERLRIARWSGKIPTSNEQNDIDVALVDGTSATGKSIRFDPDQRMLIIGDQESEMPLPLGDVVGIKFSVAEDQQSNLKSSLFLHDGSRISGQVSSIDEARLVVDSDEFAAPVQVPRELVRSLIVIKRDPIAALPNQAGRSGRLEIGQHKLTGRLLPASEQESQNASSFRWHPFGSLNSSPLKMNASGRVVYREPPPPVDPAAQQATARASALQQLRLQQQRRGLNFGELFLQKSDSKSVAKPVGRDAHKLHVRSGDVIPCVVDSIDERGVYITTAEADDAFVPHAKIKAIELVPNVSPPDLKAAKKERLLTLPRLQKSSPPTHLLCSRNGDFLRCRLLEIRDDVIRVELQLEAVEIPRERVAQIIWFHPEDLLVGNGEQGEQPDEVISLFDGLAQVLKRDGKRVTFDPREVDEEAILGTSDVLGSCRFDLSEIDQLLFGEGIREAVAVLPYNQWELHAAVEPLMAQDLSGGAEVGSESPLIGLDAPEIKLDMLDGQRFVLSECKDQIVVLDFWATWCAPCMQTMPLVEEAIAEFDPQQVRLVSVNLEESANHVRSVLERHEMTVAVALDIDGVAAQRYQAKAIPQMVIVGKDGKIARLYVGGGSGTVEQMKTAISQLLEPAS